MCDGPTRSSEIRCVRGSWCEVVASRRENQDSCSSRWAGIVQTSSDASPISSAATSIAVRQGSSVAIWIERPSCLRAAARSAVPGGPSVSAAGGEAPGMKKPVTRRTRRPCSATCRAAAARCPGQSGPRAASDAMRPRCAGSRRISRSISASRESMVTKALSCARGLRRGGG